MDPNSTVEADINTVFEFLSELFLNPLVLKQLSAVLYRKFFY